MRCGVLGWVIVGVSGDGGGVVRIKAVLNVPVRGLGGLLQKKAFKCSSG